MAQAPDDPWGHDTRASRLDQWDPTLPAPFDTGPASTFATPSRRSPGRARRSPAMAVAGAVAIALAAGALVIFS